MSERTEAIENEMPVQENKMGTMPTNRLLITMSLPMVISMLVQALYNIVDSIFVAKISENALTAVSMAFPIQSLMIAFGAGTGVGINSFLSKSLGEKKFKEASDSARNGIFLAFCTYIVFAILGFSSSGLFFRAMTDDAEIIAYGISYLRIVTVASLGVFMQITFERLLQSTGKTIYSMFMQGTGAIINIILDPILIFGLFGFPKMGVAGAAAATVFGQIVAMILGILFNTFKNKEINVSFIGFKPSLRIIKKIYAVGFPSIIMQSITSVMTYLLNKICISFTPTAVSVVGIYFKLQSFIYMPIFGLTNGLVPIVAYNYGARHKSRIISVLKLAAIISVSYMVLGVIIFQTIPQLLLGFFSASDEMLKIGIPALRIISLSFIPAGFCIIIISAFQALGHGIYSLIISIARQLGVLIPVAVITSQLFGLSAVWTAFPIAETVSLLLCIVFSKKVYQQSVAVLDNPLSINEIPEAEQA